MHTYAFSATFKKRAFQLTVLVAIAALLAWGVFAALPVQQAAAAAACNSVADGNWNTLATWGCGHIPGAVDDVVIDHAVNVSSTHAAKSITINLFGILTITAPVGLTINGNFDVVGIFDDHVGGTVFFGPGSQTIFTHGSWLDFSNLSKTSGGSLFIDPAVSGVGGLHIFGNLVLKGANPSYLLLRSTTSGSRWQIDPEGPRDLSWLDVKDSQNTGSTLNVVNLADSGNNVGWANVAAADGVTLTSSPNPSKFGTPVTFKAVVFPTTSDGTVAFKYEGGNLDGCSARPVVSGVATCTVSNLSVEEHPITAVYTFDTTVYTSTSLLQYVGSSVIYLPVVGQH